MFAFTDYSKNELAFQMVHDRGEALYRLIPPHIVSRADFKDSTLRAGAKIISLAWFASAENYSQFSITSCRSSSQITDRKK